MAGLSSRRIRSAAGPETPVIDVQTALAGRPRRTGPSFGVWALGDGAASAIGLRTEEPGAALPVNGGVVFVDPRTAAGGLRAVLPRDEGEETLADYGFTSGDLADYHRLRITHGLPDGSRDMLVEKSLLLECGFDELHGSIGRRDATLVRN